MKRLATANAQWSPHENGGQENKIGSSRQRPLASAGGESRNFRLPAIIRTWRAFAAVFLLATCYAGAEMEGPSEWDAVYAEAKAKLQAGDWDWLENTAHEWRTNKTRFRNGDWKLESLYAGVSPGENCHRATEWAECFAALKAWKAAYPESITQHVAEGGVLIDSAWEARGGATGSKETVAGWGAFGPRLARARSVLEAAEMLPEKCPEWFNKMQMIAMAQGWDRHKYDALCQRAVRFEPTYYPFYMARANFLRPRWYGRPGEWVADAERAAREDDPDEGMTVYALVVCRWMDVSGRPFANGVISWKKVKQGFEDVMSRYPDSTWNLNVYCRLAVVAEDRATARELLERIGARPEISTWESSREKFNAARKWALTERL